MNNTSKEAAPEWEAASDLFRVSFVSLDLGDEDPDILAAVGENVYAVNVPGTEKLAFLILRLSGQDNGRIRAQLLADGLSHAAVTAPVTTVMVFFMLIPPKFFRQPPAGAARGV